MKQLEELKIKLTERYGEPSNTHILRMWNTAILRWLFKSKYIRLFNNLNLENTIGESISVSLIHYTKIYLKLNNEVTTDITALVINGNKYGSAIFKRFFKFYNKNLIDELKELNNFIATMNLDWIKTCVKDNYNRTYMDVFGRRLKIVDGNVYIEKKDSSGTIIVISRPEENEIKDFCKYLYIENRTTVTNL